MDSWVQVRHDAFRKKKKIPISHSASRRHSIVDVLRKAFMKDTLSKKNGTALHIYRNQIIVFPFSYWLASSALEWRIEAQENCVSERKINFIEMNSVNLIHLLDGGRCRISKCIVRRCARRMAISTLCVCACVCRYAKLRCVFVYPSINRKNSKKEFVKKKNTYEAGARTAARTSPPPRREQKKSHFCLSVLETPFDP